IIEAIRPELRGEASTQMRPADFRLMIMTSDEGGRVHGFPNHGHPENEVSNVAFDGQNAVMSMLVGDTPQRQLFSIRMVFARMAEKGVTRLTPEFIDESIAAKDAPLRRAIAQIYGPVAPGDIAAQKSKFVDTTIMGANGAPETFKFVETADYAYGMRAPQPEEVFLVVFGGKVPVHVTGTNSAANFATSFEDAVKASVKGTRATFEQMQGMGAWTKGIVLAVDSKDGTVKPIHLGTATEIFNIGLMSIIVIDDHGRIAGQYANMRNVDSGVVLKSRPTRGPV
ncbi:MAG: hypothetical protein KGQ41_06850, partial [Alphaproteobacteria bacterium]|nr:hypothetical protein [Alphaproteobacteria bacterium]